MSEIVKKLTPRGALIVILLAVCLLFALFYYSVSRNAEISFSLNRGFKIIPKGSDRIKELEEKLTNSVSRTEHEKLQERYQQLYNEKRILASRFNRVLAASGIDIERGKDEEAVRRVEFLAARYKEMERDICVSFSVIQLEVMRGGTINTNSVHMDETKQGLYMDVQKLLRCIGIYNEEINGNQIATCQAVKQFQKHCGLVADGIIGPNTLGAMEEALEMAKQH